MGEQACRPIIAYEGGTPATGRARVTERRDRSIVLARNGNQRNVPWRAAVQSLIGIVARVEAPNV